MKYKLFTKDPIKKIEEIIVEEAIIRGARGAREELDNLRKKNKGLGLNISPFASKGLNNLRRTGQYNKQFYELFFGCIFASFLDFRKNKPIHIVNYPENESYDILIVECIKKETPVYIIEDTEFYNCKRKYEIEFTEVFKENEVINVVLNKLNKNIHDYKGRLLLVMFDFGGIFDPRKSFSDLLLNIKIEHQNFETIYLFGSLNTLDYLFYELNIYKKTCKPYLFNLPINLDRVKSKIIEKIKTKDKNMT